MTRAELADRDLARARLHCHYLVRRANEYESSTIAAAAAGALKELTNLIEALDDDASVFEETTSHSLYEATLRRAVEAKIAGKTDVVVGDAPARGVVIDLWEAVRRAGLPVPASVPKPSAKKAR